MEKVVMACLGKYLKGTDIDKVLINTEIYGPISIETVLNGDHYAEGLQSLLSNFRNFTCTTARYIFTENDKMQYDQFIDCVMCLQNLFQDRQINQSEIEMKWN